jgi:acetylglutamate kinase
MKNKILEEKNSLLKKADLLMETLPFMRRYTDKIVVIKIGGNAMGKKEYIQSFAEDIALLQLVGILPIVVHGGGPQIGEMLKKLKIESNFVDGLRVTDEATIDVVEMVLCGVTNKSIVSAISLAGALSVGISGKDGNLIKAKRLSILDKNSDSNVEKAVDLGFVGEPSSINVDVLNALISQKMIPVISPVGIGNNGETYNINADTAAGAIASAMKASRMIMLTDVVGVLDAKQELITELKISEAKNLIQNKIVLGGMIPKLKTWISSVEEGVKHQ